MEDVKREETRAGGEIHMDESKHFWQNLHSNMDKCTGYNGGSTCLLHIQSSSFRSAAPLAIRRIHHTHSNLTERRETQPGTSSKGYIGSERTAAHPRSCMPHGLASIE